MASLTGLQGGNIGAATSLGSVPITASQQAENAKETSTGMYSFANGSTANVTNGKIGATTPATMTPIYTPPAAGGSTATTPVATSGNAQADFNAKLAAFQSAQAAVANAQNLQARQAALDVQTKAQSDFQASQLKLQQQQADQKQQEINAKNAALGIATAPTKDNTTQTTTTPTQTSTTPTPITPTPSTPSAPGSPVPTPPGGVSSEQQTALTNEQQQLQQIQAQKDQVTQNQLSLLSQLQNGSIPLTPAQNTVISSLQNQLTTNTQYQQTANSAYTGAVTESMARSGGEYTPQQSAAVINNAITSGVSKIQALDNSAAQTMANLEMQFQKEDFDAVNQGYDLLQKQLDGKSSTITTMYTQTTAALKDARDYALQVAQFQQTVFKDNASLAQNQYEYRDMKDAMGNTIGTQVFDKATGKPVSSSLNAGQTNPDTGVTNPTVTTNPDGSVNKESQYATLQAVVPQPYQALVWSIVNGNGQAPNTRTAAGQKLASWVAQVDPTLSDGSGGFDATKYEARLTMQKSLASKTAGSLGSAFDSAGTVISHLGTFLNAAQGIPTTGAINPLGINTLVNDVAGGIGAMFGNTTIQKNEASAATAAIGLSDEMSKFFKGTGGTDVASIESWSKGLDPNAAPGTLNGTIQGGLDLFTGQLNTFINQYTSTMGKAPDLSKLISPQSIAELSEFKNAGFKIDLPGVYYTDKNAWQSNGGTSNQWNTAVDTLTQQGIPLTQENILQAAQIMNE